MSVLTIIAWIFRPRKKKVNIFTKKNYGSLEIIQEEFTELLTTAQLHRFYSLCLHWRPMEIRTALKITSRRSET